MPQRVIPSRVDGSYLMAKNSLLIIFLVLALTACTQVAPAPAASPAAAATTAVEASSTPGITPAPDVTPAPPDEKLKIPPVEPTPLEEPQARPTPSYFEPPRSQLPAGEVIAPWPGISPDDIGRGLLYLDQTLHVWHVDEQAVDDLGWPDVAIECPWLAPDGRTLYFADEVGVKSIDLTQPMTPTLVLNHYTVDDNPARHRRFCILGQSDSGQLLLLQARDARWYQWGVTPLDGSVVRVVESPVGPPGEAWTCPGAAVWGADGTLLLSGYSTGPCVQFPALYKTEWGRPLAPTEILTGTLPAVGDGLPAKAGATQLTRSPDGSRVAFWFDEGWAIPEARAVEQALYSVDSDGANTERLLGPLPGQNGPLAWSADSQALYYLSSEPFDTLEPHPWQVHRLDITSGASKVVAEIVARQALLFGPELDGRLSLFTLNDEFVYAFHVLDLATGDLQNGPAQVTAIDWLP